MQTSHEPMKNKSDRKQDHTKAHSKGKPLDKEVLRKLKRNQIADLRKFH